MKPSKIFDVLDLARRARQRGDVFNPLFVGPPGVGKSQIVQSWAKKQNLPFIDLRIAYMESPDLIGFPSIEVRDGRQITVHNIPEFLPKDGEGVLLLEEPNRGTTSVMNCLMQLLTDRKLHKYTLPEGWMIVGCINPEGSEYDVNTMDAALKDRFEMFEVSYDKQSFIDYMKESNWHKDIISFVDGGLWSYSLPENINNVPGAKYISPRTLSKLNTVMFSDFKVEDELFLFETVIGANVGKDFYTFRHDESPVTLGDLKKNLKKSLKKLEKFSDPNNYQPGMLNITIKDILTNDAATPIEEDLLLSLLRALPSEKGTELIRLLETQRKDDSLLEKLVTKYPDLYAQFKAVIYYGT